MNRQYEDLYARFDADPEYRENVLRTAADRLRTQKQFNADVHDIIADVRKDPAWERTDRWGAVEEATYRVRLLPRWKTAFDWEVMYVLQEWREDSGRPDQYKPALLGQDTQSARLIRAQR